MQIRTCRTAIILYSHLQPVSEQQLAFVPVAEFVYQVLQGPWCPADLIGRSGDRTQPLFAYAKAALELPSFSLPMLTGLSMLQAQGECLSCSCVHVHALPFRHHLGLTAWQRHYKISSLAHILSDKATQCGCGICLPNITVYVKRVSHPCQAVGMTQFLSRFWQVKHGRHICYCAVLQHAPRGMF